MHVYFITKLHNHNKKLLKIDWRVFSTAFIIFYSFLLDFLFDETPRATTFMNKNIIFKKDLIKSRMIQSIDRVG